MTLDFHSFTLPKDQDTLHSFGPHTLVVFGMPTYAGRIPNKALPFVQKLFSGDPDRKTPAVALVTFGNRSYDSSLRNSGMNWKRRISWSLPPVPLRLPMPLPPLAGNTLRKKTGLVSGSCWTGRKPGSGAENPWSGS